MRMKTHITMKKTFKILGIVLVVALFVGTFVFLYQKSRPKAQRFEVIEVKRADIRRSTIVTGTIEPRVEVDVKPQISGIVAEIFKEAGQTVQKGELIARIKVVPDMAQLNSAENRVKLAQLSSQQALRDFERTKTLYDQKLVSAEEFEKAQLALRQQREELANAKDALKIVKEGVSNSMAGNSTTLVRSTIDGTILDIPVKVGNSVTMSNTFNDGTTIATVANMNDLLFKGNIDETEVGRLRPGMTLQITVGALQNLRFTARLEYISPKAVESNGANQFEIKAAVQPREDGHIRSGYSANAEIVLAEARGALTIPESAVEFVGKEAFVYVAKGTGKTLTYERRRVSLGLSDGIDIEIKSGLKAGEKVRGPKQTAPSAS